MAVMDGNFFLQALDFHSASFQLENIVLMDLSTMEESLVTKPLKMYDVWTT